MQNKTSLTDKVAGGCMALWFAGASFVVFKTVDVVVTKHHLEKSNYIAKSPEPNQGTANGITLYGYDDDKDHSIDRIERVGLIGAVCGRGCVTIPIKETYTPRDKNFETYYTFLLK